MDGLRTIQNGEDKPHIPLYGMRGSHEGSARDHVQETYIRTYLTVNVGFVPTLVVLGLVGNTLSFLVLGHDRSMKKSARSLLRSLAVADSLFLIACLFSQTLYTINYHTEWSPTLQQYYPWIELVAWPASNTTQTMAVWMVVAVTADRYIAICKPLRSTQLSNESRVRKVVISVWILSIAYNLPRYFEYRIVHHTDMARNETIPCVEETELHQNMIYFLIYRMCCNFLFRFMAPFCALIFFNVQLGQAVTSSIEAHRRESGSQKARRSNTVMMIGVVAVFLVCEMPSYLRRVCEVLVKFQLVQLHDEPLNFAIYITNLLLTVNSAVNFLIYLFLGQRFRTILHAMLCRRQTFTEIVTGHRTDSVLTTKI